MDARDNPEKVSAERQNREGHIGGNTRERLTKRGEQRESLPREPKRESILREAKKHDGRAEIGGIA